MQKRFEVKKTCKKNPSALEGKKSLRIADEF